MGNPKPGLPVGPLVPPPATPPFARRPRAELVWGAHSSVPLAPRAWPLPCLPVGIGSLRAPCRGLGPRRLRREMSLPGAGFQEPGLPGPRFWPRGPQSSPVPAPAARPAASTANARLGTESFPSASAGRPARRSPPACQALPAGGRCTGRPHAGRSPTPATARRVPAASPRGASVSQGLIAGPLQAQGSGLRGSGLSTVRPALPGPCTPRPPPPSLHPQGPPCVPSWDRSNPPPCEEERGPSRGKLTGGHEGGGRGGGSFPFMPPGRLHPPRGKAKGQPLVASRKRRYKQTPAHLTATQTVSWPPESPSHHPHLLQVTAEGAPQRPSSDPLP